MKDLKEIINQRIKEKHEWVENVEELLNSSDKLTKKERHHYLNEIIVQLRIIEDLEKVKCLQNELND